MPDQIQAAELLPLTPTSQEQLVAAARVTARHAHSRDDLALLLDVLALPRIDTPLPAHTDNDAPACPTGDESAMPQKTLNAFEATALSMHRADTPIAEITEATGLSEEEINTLVAAQEQGAESTATATITDVPHTAAAVTVPAGVEELLRWTEQHQLTGVRNRAARIRSELADFTARRDEEAATREAEERVARAKAELEKAQEELRAAKASTRAAASPTSAAAPTPISTRNKKQLAAIRTWARANGHQVADQGRVPQAIVDAYDAAHQAPTTKAG
ncbi:histone-like nucleoid-structuring protein Lsr2 [Streptomyces niveus]|uniref:Lsr2 family DNA-binding protein n=1 Tax=Streptomyces niveus TaxID=193462 RepID=UPI0036D3B471